MQINNVAKCKKSVNSKKFFYKNLVLNDIIHADWLYRENFNLCFLKAFELIKNFFISPKRIYPEFKYLDKPTHKFSASRLSAFCHPKCHFVQSFD